jgi:hypothetical protein
LTVVGGTGFAGLLGHADSDAKGRKKKKKKKNKNNNNVSPPPPPPPPPNCSDGIKNADETDIDCGGSCPRCGNGKICASFTDCASALCLANVCQECTSSAQCDSGGKGACTCEQAQIGGFVCSSSAPPANVGNCAACPPGTNCIAGFAGFQCKQPCGAA